jgi:hypothetical protein
MLPLSPALFLAAASALVASDDREPRIPRWRRWVHKELNPVKRDSHEADDRVMMPAFIGHIGYWSHRVTAGSSSWPLPLDADCDALAQIGLDRGVAGVGRPEPGAMYLRWSRTEQRFTRASIVVEVLNAAPPEGSAWGYDCEVLEGAAVLSRFREERDDPTRAPFKTTVRWARRSRVVCCPALGDRFLSWVDLDARNERTRACPSQAA